jgi:peptide/nickel transport system permease protein
MAQATALSPAVDNALFTTPVRRRPGVMHFFLKHQLATIGVLVLAILGLAAIFAPLIVHYDPNAISLDILAGPSPAHLLGTDDIGRDMLTRLIYASRVSLAVGLVSSILTVVLGVVIGSLAGYCGGTVDTLLSAFINVMLSIPVFPLALVLGSFLTTDLTFVVLIIGLLSWMGVARIIRAEFMSLKEREFTQAAGALGVPAWRIIVRHILPNTVAPIIVAATIQVASGILLESSLSYLGYGIQPPTASWGNMLQNAQRFLRTAPEVAIYPGALISMTVIAINFVGDGLRDALDPRMRI